MTSLPDLASLVRAAAREVSVADLPALGAVLREGELLVEMRLRSATLSTNGSGSEAEDRVLSMRDVAGRLGVSLYTAREMGRRGELPVTTLGRRVGVRDASLRRFLDMRERGGHKG